MRNMIKLRIDVDYAYPSRVKSFLHTALELKARRDYLKNSKIIAKMINESSEEVKGYWFFTPKTIPDKELLDMLNEERHEVALHIAKSPYEEIKLLEESTGRKLSYYTIHGTSRLFARVIWKRWKSKAPEIPKNFPLKSFHQLPTLRLDWQCYANDSTKVVRKAKKSIAEGRVLHIHPVWLFQRGTINHRGPFYEAFRRILKVDEEMDSLAVKKKLFFKVASDKQEYLQDVNPTEDFIEKLAGTEADILTFVERKWCCPLAKQQKHWAKTEDNVALLQLTTYDQWWGDIGKKTRNMVRKAEKSGVETEVVEPDEKLAEGIWKIYNETPIRQERAFPHYGTSLQAVTRSMLAVRNCTFIGSFFQGELIGFIQLLHNSGGAMVSQILSLQNYWDKSVNNALIAKAVEFCANNKIRWLLYGRMGNHPSLDKFKQSNGFSKFSVVRYYVPITRKGKLAVKLGLQRESKDVLPEPLKAWLIPLYNWVSRNKIRAKQVSSS
jgi:hypothetical protein